MECPQCHHEFEPRRIDQRYCSARCRVRHYAEHVGDGALRARIRGVRKLGSGEISVTLRFSQEEADNAFALTPGQIIEVISGVNPLRPTLHRASSERRPVFSEAAEC